MDCLRDLMATLTNQTLLVMVGSYPRHKRATIPRQTRAPPTISLCHCPQNTTAGRVWLYTLLYGNSLYRLYATAIHPYTSFTPCPGSSVTLYSIYSVYSYTAYSTIQPPSGGRTGAGSRNAGRAPLSARRLPNLGAGEAIMSATKQPN